MIISQIPWKCLRSAFLKYMFFTMLFIPKCVHVHCFVSGRVIRTGHPNYLHFVTCQINYDPPPLRRRESKLLWCCPSVFPFQTSCLSDKRPYSVPEDEDVLGLSGYITRPPLSTPSVTFDSNSSVSRHLPTRIPAECQSKRR